MRLTAKERIVLHLGEFTRYADAVDVAPGMTQDGIARAAGVELRHLAQYLRPLVKEGHVRERLAHVAGIRQRRKVYDLTESGRRGLVRIREAVLAERVRIRSGGDVREGTVAEALAETAGKAALVDIVRAAMAGEAVDLVALAAPKPATMVEVLSEAPRPLRFVGRHAELAAITGEGEGPHVFVIRGVAGIGKSSFAAKACEVVRGTRHVFWDRVRPWDTRQSVLASLGDFLSSLGKPGLRAVVARGESGRADDVLRQDLPGLHAFLVFDDAHEASPEVLSVLGFLKDAIAEAPRARMLVLTRRALPFYDARDLAVRGLVREIDLGGLSGDEITEFLSGTAAGLLRTAQHLGGHPLFLELLRASAHAERLGEGIHDVHRFIEEQVYTGLSEGERAMMKAAALYRVPVPREALFADPAASHDALVSLTNRSLIRRIGDGAYGLHDTIREFFSTITTPSERERLAEFAVAQLSRLAVDAQRAGNDVAAIHCLSNALEVAGGGKARSPLLEALGDTHERIGDLPAALAAYAAALDGAPASEDVARLHRKSAAARQVRGDIPGAREEVELGLRVLEGRASIERGWLRLVESRIASKEENWAAARRHGSAALEIFREANDATGQARTLLELANVEIYSPQGVPAAAEEHLTSALEVSRTSEDSEFRARVHIALANLYANRTGDLGRATQQMEAIKSLEGSIRDPHVRRSLLMLRAWFALQQQAEYAAARDLFTKAREIGERIQDPSTVAFAKYGLAHVLYFERRIDKARTAFEEFAREIEGQGFPGYGAEGLWMAAECSLRLGDLGGFLRIAEEYRDSRRSAGYSARPLHTKVLEGLEGVARGDRPASDAAFAEALRLLDTHLAAREGMLEGFVHFYYGVALCATGRKDLGKDHLQSAIQRLESVGLVAQLTACKEGETDLVECLHGGFSGKGSARR